MTKIMTLFGFLTAAAVFGFGTLTSTNQPSTFIDQHAFLIVIGGSFAASMISFRADRLLLLFRIFFMRVLNGSKSDYNLTIRALVEISAAYRTGPEAAKAAARKFPDFFLNEAVATLAEDTMDPPTLARILKKRVTSIYARYADDAAKMKIVGKFPPAFGLMGTTLGMIALLQKLGEPGAQSKIGPAMAIGLVATLYGIALSNLLFIPIAENLLQEAKELKQKNLIIVEGIRLIAERTNPIMLLEELNSFVLPGERVSRKAGAPRKAA